MFSASAGVSSMASHTLAKRFLLIDPTPSIDPDSVGRPDRGLPCAFFASSSENSAGRKRHLRISPHTSRGRPLLHLVFEFPSRLVRRHSWVSSYQARAHAALDRADMPP